MSNRIGVFWALILSLIVEGGRIAAGQPVGTAFTYQGQLKDTGVPANGPHDFVFRLFDDANVQVGGAITMNGHLVIDGLFNGELDFGPGVFTGGQRELEVQVNGTVLTPRQPLTATPFAMYALDGPGGSGPWTVNSGNIHNTNAGNVGIGTTAPLTELHVRGSNATLRLEDMDIPGGYSLLEDAQPTQLRISKTNNNGIVLLDMNPKPADGISGTDIRFFRETNTSGLKTVRFLRGNNTTSPSAVIGVDGANSSFQLHGGNLGIGTSAPSSKLSVVGDLGATSAIQGTGYHGVTGSSTDAAGYGGYFDGAGALFSGQALFAAGESHLAGFVGIGTTDPQAALHVVDGSDASPSGGGIAILGSTSSNNIAIDNNEIMARNNGGTSTLYLNKDGGDIVCGGPLDIGYEVVNASFPTNGNDVVVHCPPGKRVLSGICNCYVPGTPTPINNGTGVYCHCSEGAVNAIAICANVK